MQDVGLQIRDFAGAEGGDEALLRLNAFVATERLDLFADVVVDVGDGAIRGRASDGLIGQPPELVVAPGDTSAVQLRHGVPVPRGVERVPIRRDQVLACGAERTADLHRLHPVERVVGEPATHAVRVIVGAEPPAVVVMVRGRAAAAGLVADRAESVERVIVVPDSVGAAVALDGLAVASHVISVRQTAFGAGFREQAITLIVAVAGHPSRIRHGLAPAARPVGKADRHFRGERVVRDARAQPARVVIGVTRGVAVEVRARMQLPVGEVRERLYLSERQGPRLSAAQTASVCEIRLPNSSYP